MARSKRLVLKGAGSGAGRWAGIWIAGLLALAPASLQAQEITTTYQYSHCWPHESCQYNEDETGQPHWGKTIEPDGTWALTDHNNAAGETKERRYDSASTLLQTADTTWVTPTPPGGNRRNTVKTYLNDANAYWSLKEVTYDSNNNITQEDVESTISIGLPFKKRRITRTWTQISGTLMYRLNEESVHDLDGSSVSTLVSRTDYNYDEFSLTGRSGMTGHDTDLPPFLGPPTE